MIIYIKYNEVSKYGVSWNLSKFSLLDIYSILGNPKTLIRLPFENTSNPEYCSIEKPDAFFTHHSTLNADFACVDCNHHIDSRNAMSYNDMQLMRQIFDEDKPINYQFQSVKNSFVWYSHDNGDYSAIYLTDGHFNFLLNCLNQILRISSYKFSLIPDNSFEELFQYAKRGIRIDTRNVLCDGKSCEFTFECCLDNKEFVNLLCDDWKVSECKLFRFCVK